MSLPRETTRYVNDTEQQEPRPRVTPVRRGGGEPSYARRRKRTTHYAGIHRRRARRWNW
ncbi:MAG: hypothetical protein GTO03_04545 [Planctomycetales bacterium]|nr:hypothetical protein [Planctomycetales bacterium]